MFLLHFIVNVLVIFGLAQFLPGVSVETIWTAVIVALVLGVLNLFLKPMLVLLTLPLNILTFGLFSTVINAGLLMLTALVVTGFRIEGFLYALLFGVVFSLAKAVLSAFHLE